MSEEVIKEKHRLINAFFAVGGNHRKKERNAIVKELKKFDRKYRDDDQIESVLILANAYSKLDNGRTFGETERVAEQALRKMANKETWDFYDFKIASNGMGMIFDGQLTNFLTKRIFDMLETQYKDEEFYEIAKVNIHTLLTLNYIGYTYTNKNDNELNIKDNFDYHIDQVLAVANETTYPLLYAYVLIRKGYFYKEQKYTAKGYKVLKDMNEIQAIKLMKQEQGEYNLIMYGKVGKKQLMVRTGDNVRKLRVAMGLTGEDVAFAIGVTASKISDIENAKQQLSAFEVVELANLFNVTTDELLMHEVSDKKEYTDAYSLQVMAILNKLSPDAKKAHLKSLKAISEIE